MLSEDDGSVGAPYQKVAVRHSLDIIIPAAKGW